MTFAGLTAEPSFATDYEQLRSHRLDGAIPPGARFGLVILLREGVAAWMAHASALPARVVHDVADDRPSVTGLIADEVHADLVAVLASMVMTATHEERFA